MPLLKVKLGLSSGSALGILTEGTGPPSKLLAAADCVLTPSQDTARAKAKSVAKDQAKALEERKKVRLDLVAEQGNGKNTSHHAPGGWNGGPGRT